MSSNALIGRTCRLVLNACDLNRVLPGLWLLGAGLGVPAALHAQARPDAGQTLESLRPQPQLPARNPAAALPQPEDRPALSVAEEEPIAVRRWRITGAHVFPTAQLSALVQDYAGQELRLSQLHAAAARITAFYQQHGYLLTRAYIPAQDISDGTVEIAVLEGRVASVHVVNTSHLASSAVSERLDGLKGVEAVNASALERSLLLLNDLPGVEVRSTLRPGASVGSSDLDVRVRGTGRISGSADADSFGNRYTGTFRGGGTVNMNNLLGQGDLLTLRANTAGSGMNYGRAAWQVPIGASGWHGGIAWSDLGYRLGESFQSLDAHGTAQVGTVWAGYPLLRSQATNLSVQLSYDHKRLNDRVDATLTDSQKKLGVWSLTFSGDHLDSLGGDAVNSYSVSLVSGRLTLDPLSLANDQGISGHRTEGRYGKLAISLTRLQRLSAHLSLYAALSGQRANANLDSAEKLSLGGAYAVRAYPEGEALGDDAAVLTLELRASLPRWPQVQPLVFADAGTVWVNHAPTATDPANRRTLAGEGLGMQWLNPGHFGLKAYLAWRSGPAPTSDADRRPRLGLQFAQYF